MDNANSAETSAVSLAMLDLIMPPYLFFSSVMSISASLYRHDYRKAELNVYLSFGQRNWT